MATYGWRVTVLDRVDDALALVRADGFERTPFQDAEWMTAWVRTLGAEPGVVPIAVVVRTNDDERPVMVLPLALVRGRGVVRLTAWDRGVGDYNGALIRPDLVLDPDGRRSLWAAIRAALPAADLVDLEKGPERIGTIANPFVGLAGAVPSDFRGHPLALSVDYAGLAERAFDGTTRRSLARKRKKLRAKGALEFTVETGPATVAGVERVLEWRARRFPTAAETARDGHVWGFYRRLAAEAGIVRLASLTLDGRPIAGGFGTLTGGTFQLVAVGHDARFDNWSAGLLAIESLIEWACAAGVAAFDFTVGEEPYKRAFGVDSAPLVDFADPLTLKGRLYLVARRLRRDLRAFKRRLSARRAAAARH